MIKKGQGACTYMTRNPATGVIDRALTRTFVPTIPADKLTFNEQEDAYARLVARRERDGIPYEVVCLYDNGFIIDGPFLYF